MTKLIFSLLLVFSPATFALFVGDSVVSLKRPEDLNFKIDGFPDSIWYGVANSSYNILSFSDTSKLVLPNNVTTGDYQTYSSTGIKLLSFWDDDYIYFGILFDLKTVNVIYQQNFGDCDIDHPDIWLDQSSWDPINYKTYFGAVDENKLGLYTKRFQTPIHPERRYFGKYSKMSDNSFVTESSPVSVDTTHAASVFEDGTTYSLSYNNSNRIFLELKIPWEATAIAQGYPEAVYINFGFSESLQSWTTASVVNSCNELKPILHYWAAQKPSHISPDKSEDAWGKLVLSRQEVVPSTQSASILFSGGDFIQGENHTNMVGSEKGIKPVKNYYLRLQERNIKSKNSNGERFYINGVNKKIGKGASPFTVQVIK